jgi:hypothetical protein
MKVGVEVEAGAGAEAEVGEARRGLHFRPALLFGSGPARRRGISVPLTAIILTAALIAITSAVATGSMIYISAAGRGFKEVALSPALVLHETIESIYLSNPGTSATVTLKNELGPITSSPANSSTTVTFPCPLPAAAPGYALPDPAGIVSSVKVGGALSLNGVNGYTNRPSVAGLNRNALTFAFWSKQNDVRSFFMHPIGLFGGHRATIYVPPNTYRCNYKFSSINGISYEGTIATLDGNWHFIAVTFDGTQIKCYLDGVLKITVSAPGSITGGDESLFIGTTGTGSSPSGNWFCGFVDDVLIFSRALNGTEVSYLYQYRVPMNSSGLVGWWKFDEGMPGTAIDSSGMGNNCTDYNSARALFGPSEVTYNMKMNQFTIPAGTCRVTVSKNMDGSLELEAVAG